MSKNKYIGMIQEEFDDDFSLGYRIDSNLKALKKWRKEMITCNGVEDCKIFQLREIK